MPSACQATIVAISPIPFRGLQLSPSKAHVPNHVPTNRRNQPNPLPGDCNQMRANHVLQVSNNH